MVPQEGFFVSVTPLQIRSLVWALTVLGVCALALWRGGRFERLAAGVMLAAWAVSMLVDKTGFDEPEWGVMTVDLAALAVFVWIALKSDRFWPIFAAAFHLLSIVTHLARTVDSTVLRYAYMTAEILWGYFLAFAIAYGALTSASERFHPSDGAPGATLR